MWMGVGGKGPRLSAEIFFDSPPFVLPAARVGAELPNSVRKHRWRQRIWCFRDLEVLCCLREIVRTMRPLLLILLGGPLSLNFHQQILSPAMSARSVGPKLGRGRLLGRPPLFEKEKGLAHIARLLPSPYAVG